MGSIEENSSSKSVNKLPYFHRMLDPSDAALLGSSAPKPLPMENSFSGAPTPGSGSAWNAAGSWEETDYTAKASALLENIMDGDIDGLAPGFIILSCQEVSGSASLVHSKGKARYLYAFTVKLKCEIAPPLSGDKTYQLFLTLDDVQNDQDADDYDLSIEWISGSPGGDRFGAVKSAILSSKTREALRNKLANFESAYQAKQWVVESR